MRFLQDFQHLKELLVGRIERITSEVRNYDRELYCAMNSEGKPCIYRKSKRTEVFDLGDGNVLLNVRPAPYYIFALTHDWKPTGEVVDWGLVPIIQRLREIDGWKRDLMQEFEKNEEKANESQDRKRKNQMEDFSYVLRDHVKKETKDVVLPSHLIKKRKGV